mgnify:CR=1 FL=1
MANAIRNATDKNVGEPYGDEYDVVVVMLPASVEKVDWHAGRGCKPSVFHLSALPPEAPDVRQPSLGMGCIHADYDKYTVIDGVRVKRGMETRNSCHGDAVRRVVRYQAVIARLEEPFRLMCASCHFGYIGAMYKAGEFNYKLSDTGKQGNLMGSFCP